MPMLSMINFRLASHQDKLGVYLTSLPGGLFIGAALVLLPLRL